MAAFLVARARNFLYLDTHVEAQLHKTNRLWEPGSVMGDSPGIHGRLLGSAPSLRLTLQYKPDLR